MGKTAAELNGDGLNQTQVALQALQYSSENKMTDLQLSEKFGCSISSISSARVCLNEGLPEELEALRNQQLSVTTLARRIRTAISLEDRKAALVSKHRYTAESKEQQQFRVAIINSLKIAFTELTNLPLPSDVAAIVRTHHISKEMVNRLLQPAANWIKEFEHAWTNSNSKQQINKPESDVSDARFGNEISGREQTQSSTEPAAREPHRSSDQSR